MLSFYLFLLFYTGNIKIDRALQIVLYGVGCGMSGSWWRNQHNKHHAMPQKIGHDVDLNTLPLVAFTEKVSDVYKEKLYYAYLIYTFHSSSSFLMLRNKLKSRKYTQNKTK